MKRIFALISVIILGCQSSTKTEEPSFKQLTNLIDQYADNTLKKGNINSLAVAVYKDGQVYHNYYGSIHKNYQNLPNDNTLYEIASIRLFAGLSLDKPILDHSTILKFRHLLERHGLARKIVSEVRNWLTEAGVLIKG